jgi:hypothetical protein
MSHGNFGIRSIPPCGDCWEDGTCSMNCGPASLPKALGAAAETVLHHRPKPKTAPARARKRRAASLAKAKVDAL